METKKEVDLREVFEILAKKWWLILLLTVFGAVIAFGVSVKYVTPVYEAKTVLYIGNENSVLAPLDISLGQLEAGSQLLVDYKQIALTRLVINEVIKNLGLNISYEEFQKNMVIENVGDSRLFTVGYRNPNPETARIVSDELAKQLSVAVLQIVGVENIRILDQALLPHTPAAPNKYLNTAIGALLGFLTSLFIIFIMFLLDDTVKNEEDIEKLIGMSVLGNIPEFKKEA